MKLNSIELVNPAALDAKPPVPITVRVELVGLTTKQAREVGALSGKEVRIVGATPEESPHAVPTLPLDPREWELLVQTERGSIVPPGEGWFLLCVGSYGYPPTEFSPGESGAVLMWARKRETGEAP